MKTMTLASAGAKGSKGWPARSNTVTAGEDVLALSVAGGADDVPPGEFPLTQPEMKKAGNKTRIAHGFRREALVRSGQATFCPHGNHERWGETPSSPGIQLGDGESRLEGSLAPPCAGRGSGIDIGRSNYTTGAALRFARMASMIFFARSGFSASVFCAASFPCPINSPVNCNQAPFFSTTPFSMPTSRTLPSLLMPWLKMMSNSASANGGATLFFTIFTFT